MLVVVLLAASWRPPIHVQMARWRNLSLVVINFSSFRLRTGTGRHPLSLSSRVYIFFFFSCPTTLVQVKMPYSINAYAIFKLVIPPSVQEMELPNAALYILLLWLTTPFLSVRECSKLASRTRASPKIRRRHHKAKTSKRQHVVPLYNNNKTSGITIRSTIWVKVMVWLLSARSTIEGRQFFLRPLICARSHGHNPKCHDRNFITLFHGDVIR